MGKQISLNNIKKVFCVGSTYDAAWLPKDYVVVQNYEKADIVIFPGGSDWNPALYNQLTYFRTSFFPDIDNISIQENGENDTDKSGNKSISRVKSKTNSLQLGSYFSLTSNLDYITTLEFGLYPNPVKNGTPYQIADRDGFITETGFVKLSENGFSKKAPAGFLGINIMRFQNFVNQANKDIK